MIANAFSQYAYDDDVILFASGVSNSKENRVEKYERELSLLKFCQNNLSDKKIIYFSTCSVFDKALKNSDYIKHKLNIENFISNNFKKYLIFRLPNVVGRTDNKNTFFNFFKNSILNDNQIEVKKHDIRYLIDVDDLLEFLPIFIEGKKHNNKIIEVAVSNRLYVTEIIKMYEEILNKKASIKLIEGGNNKYPFEYSIDYGYFCDSIKNSAPIFDKNYTYNLLKKYLL